ncbi:MAG: hypothetical protein ACRD1I_01305 [Terriglobia bacterium]
MRQRSASPPLEPFTTFILGAGFSKCADLPLQGEFSTLLLSEEFETELDKTITKALQGFLKVAFGWERGRALPALEDVFTCIDLAAGSGHNLGIRKYTPKYLRAIRRMAVHRIFSVLDRSFSYSSDIEALLREFCPSEDSRCAFVVLNWDIVLEKHIRRVAPTAAIDYRCFCFDWNACQPSPIGHGVPICKIHGSSNWVYCDNCKSLFFDLEQKLPLQTKAGLIKADFRLLDSRFSNARFDATLGIAAEARNCKFCGFPVSSHIATFSYTKSFRTHAYASVWYHAERLLADSTHWVFIGYSLPEADFELKQILKSASLRMQHQRTKAKKTIDVIVLDDHRTQEKYEAFFGADTVRCFQAGLPGYLAGLGNPKCVEDATTHPKKSRSG